MKRYIYYLLFILKVIGLIALTVTPGILTITLCYYTKNLYYCFILTSYLFITPYLCIVGEKTGLLEELKK